MTNSAKIKEIFDSIQGEGPYIGYRQLFIRFCECNLKCKYCDTDFAPNEGYTAFSPEALKNYITDNFELNKIHSISLTGGEPLLSYEFLREFLPLTDKRIYLETNGTLFEELLAVKNFVHMISADIKLKSATGMDTFNLHEKFFRNCEGVETFAKIVFNGNIEEDEIEDCVKLAKRYNLPLILQPETKDDKINVSTEFIYSVADKFASKYNNVRLIPQTHKFMGLE